MKKETSNRELVAKFYDLQWEPASTYLLRGVKSGRKPRRVYAGGNGSFVVGESAKLILTVETQRGRLVEKDIYRYVRDYSDKHITAKFRESLEKKLSTEKYIVLGKEITNINEIFDKIF